MKLLSAIVLVLALSLPAMAAEPPAGWIKKLEDSGMLINRPIIVTHCGQPLMLIIPQPKANEIAVYDGPAMASKASKDVFSGQYLTFDIAPILGVDCGSPTKDQKPKKKRFYRSISL